MLLRVHPSIWEARVKFFPDRAIEKSTSDFAMAATTIRQSMRLSITKEKEKTRGFKSRASKYAKRSAKFHRGEYHSENYEMLYYRDAKEMCPAYYTGVRPAHLEPPLCRLLDRNPALEKQINPQG